MEMVSNLVKFRVLKLDDEDFESWSLSDLNLSNLEQNKCSLDDLRLSQARTVLRAVVMKILEYDKLLSAGIREKLNAVHNGLVWTNEVRSLELMSQFNDIKFPKDFLIKIAKNRVKNYVVNGGISVLFAEDKTSYTFDPKKEFVIRIDSQRLDPVVNTGSSYKYLFGVFKKDGSVLRENNQPVFLVKIESAQDQSIKEPLNNS